MTEPFRAARFRRQRRAPAWPGATVRVLPGAGHMLPIERPDEIVESIQGAVVQTDASALPHADSGEDDQEPSLVVEPARAVRTH